MSVSNPPIQGVGAFARHAAKLVANGYRIIPIPLGGKGPQLKDWRDKWPRSQGAAAEMAKHHKVDGVGIITTETPAIDLDILDADLVAQMLQFISDNFEAGPLRIGKAPKSLLLYATDEPFSKVTSASFIDPANPTRADGKPLKQRVEVLGDGQQFVAFHVHPETGKPYVWPEPGEDPLDIDTMDLPILRAEHARAVCSFFEKVATEAGWQRADEGLDGAGGTVELLALAAPPGEVDAEVDRVKAALAHISPDCSREDYLAVLAALRWTRWFCAEELALDWAMGSEQGKFNERDFKRDWDSFKAERTTRSTVTLGSMFKLAKDAGWDAARQVDPEVADATFEALMARVQALAADDRQARKSLIKDIAASPLAKDDVGELTKALAKVLKIPARDVKSYLHEAKSSSRDHGEPTHANYAKALLALLEERTGHAPVGCEGKLWTFNSSEGIWVGATPTEFEVEVAKAFDGLENCSRRNDYLAVANHAHSIASAGKESWFDDAPVGLACGSRFYTVVEGEIVREPLGAQHRQRLVTAVSPKVMETPLWDRLMSMAFDGDEDREQELLLEEYIGAAILGAAPRYERALLMKGVGRAGKGTILKIVAAMLPREAGCAVEPEKWSREYYLADLAGKRINIVGELSDEFPIDGAAFKRVIGRDQLTARHPTHRPFNFTNSAGHIFNSNFFVPTKDHSDEFFTRWILIEFRNSLIGKEDQIDVDFAKKIIENELPGVMAKMLKGAQRLMARKHFQLTLAHHRLMAQWRNRSSSVLEFLHDEDVCRLGTFPHIELRRGVLFAAYSTWCREANRKPMGKHKFYDEMLSPVVKSTGVKFVKKSGDTVLVRGVVLANQVFGSVEDDEL